MIVQKFGISNLSLYIYIGSVSLCFKVRGDKFLGNKYKSKNSVYLTFKRVCQINV